MNRLSADKRTQVLRCLVEGVSIRGTSRITGVNHGTIANLLRKAGVACTAFLDENLINLPCTQVQCDEIWSFVYAKDKRLFTISRRAPRIVGTVWTWVAMCSDTKLVCSWLIGDRTTESAIELMRDLEPRFQNRIQLTTDGHSAYQEAVELAFGGDIDYAQLVKSYSTRGGDEGEQRNGEKHAETSAFIRKDVMAGHPDPTSISTSHVERQNLTMRMGMRRFTRRTNGFSKRIENHAHQVALHFMHYNFVRIHQSLRVTPAMEAGLTSHLWELSDIVDLIAEREPRPGPRGPYRKRRRCKLIDSPAKHEAERMEHLLSVLMADAPEPEEPKPSISQALLEREWPTPTSYGTRSLGRRSRTVTGVYRGPSGRICKTPAEAMRAQSRKRRNNPPLGWYERKCRET